MTYPYPDEPTWWANYETEVDALFAEAGQVFPNPQAFRWFARPAYDIGAGLDPATARRKHLTALREALGLPFDPPVGTLPRRVVQGQFFALEDGTPWTMIQCSDFNLLGRVMAGEDIRPVLEQRRAVRFNTLRVFTAYNVPGIGTLQPSVGLYGPIPGFLDLCASYGLYVELVAFTGPYTGLFADDDAKVLHWEDLREVSRFSSNVSLELVNEGDHPANKDLPFSRLRRPVGILASHGSAMADQAPMLPVWDYTSYHSNDLNEWQRKVGHNAMEFADLYDVPATANENTRGDKDGYIVRHASDAAAGAALLPAGACCHTPRGKTSELWDGEELGWARAWARGARSVPLDFQRGAYHHRTNLEGPDVIRAYDRRLPDGREFVVMIRT